MDAAEVDKLILKEGIATDRHKKRIKQAETMTLAELKAKLGYKEPDVGSGCDEIDI